MPNRRYTLGARSLRLASGWIDRLLQVAAAPMTRIADGCGETVYLLQLVGTRGGHVGPAAGGRRAMIEGGNRAVLSALGDGRGACAARHTCRARKAPSLLPAEPFPAFTPRTKTTWSDVNAAIRPAGATACMPRRARSTCPELLRHAAAHGDRDEKLALAVSFETRRAESERRPSSRRCNANGAKSLPWTPRW